MTIAELIIELQKYPQSAEIAIHDADTDWTLPIHVGYGPYGRQMKLATNELDETIYIFGFYSERLE